LCESLSLGEGRHRGIEAEFKSIPPPPFLKGEKIAVRLIDN